MNYYDLIYLFIVLAITGIINGEMDTLKDQPVIKRKPVIPPNAMLFNFNLGLWYNTKHASDIWNYNVWLTRLLIRFPFSFLQNGWHFLKFLMLISIFGFIAYYHQITGLMILDSFILYYVFGFWFNISYHELKEELKIYGN